MKDKITFQNIRVKKETHSVITKLAAAKMINLADFLEEMTNYYIKNNDLGRLMKEMKRLEEKGRVPIMGVDDTIKDSVTDSGD